MSESPVWVLDTNVLLSALISDRGVPARLWSECLAGKFRPAFDGLVLSEYLDVFYRPEFGLLPPAIANFVSALLRIGVEIHAPPLVHGVLGLPDADDQIFLAAALLTPDRVLVTGNSKHFPARFRRGVIVLTPREALTRLQA